MFHNSNFLAQTNAKQWNADYNPNQTGLCFLAKHGRGAPAGEAERLQIFSRGDWD
jgi:hypothetical protein